MSLHGFHRLRDFLSFCHYRVHTLKIVIHKVIIPLIRKIIKCLAFILESMASDIFDTAFLYTSTLSAVIDDILKECFAISIKLHSTYNKYELS